MTTETLSRAQLQWSEEIKRRLLDTSQGGSVAFLAGVAGSGRTFLLQSVSAELARSNPLVRVVYGSVVDGRYEQAEHADTVLADAMERFAGGYVLSGLWLLHPGFAVLRELLRLSAAAARVVQDKLDLANVSDLVAHALRAAALDDAERPLLCIVDDADQLQSSWWMALRLSLAKEIADGLPLVLVLAVDDPPTLDPTAEDSSPAASAARWLGARNQAVWWSLAPLERTDIEAWLGSAPPQLLRTVLELTDGRTGAIAELWADLQHRGVIRREQHDRWELASEEGLWSYGVQGLAVRLQTLLPTRSEDERSLVGTLLAHGALEGREFTAQALAPHFPGSEEELIDILDELDDESDRSRGLLVELGSVELGSLQGETTRNLWRYRFVRSIDWLAARHLVDRGENDREAATDLAKRLAALYEPEDYLIAPTLARLFREGGKSRAARRYARQSRRAMTRAAMSSQARYIKQASAADWKARDFADAARVLLDAAHELDGRERLSDTVTTAEVAVEFARQAEGLRPGLLADALHMHGRMLRKVDALDAAEPALAEAERLATDGSPEALAAILFERGALADSRTRTRPQARAFYEAADDIAASNGLKQLQAVVLAALMSLESDFDDAKRAWSYGEQASAILVEIEDFNNLGTVKHHLAGLLEEEGEFDGAIELVTEALYLKREYGEVVDEAACMRRLGEIEYLKACANEDPSLLDTAAGHAREALSMQEEVDDGDGVAASNTLLGRIVGERSADEALLYFRRAIVLYLELGNQAAARQTQGFIDALAGGK